MMRDTKCRQDAHERTQGDFAKQIQIVPKGTPYQDVVVVDPHPRCSPHPPKVNHSIMAEWLELKEVRKAAGASEQAASSLAEKQQRPCGTLRGGPTVKIWDKAHATPGTERGQVSRKAHKHITSRRRNCNTQWLWRDVLLAVILTNSFDRDSRELVAFRRGHST